MTRLADLTLFGVVELLTLTTRRPEPAFDITPRGLSMLSEEPLAVGTLVLAVLTMPGEGVAHDVIVRISSSEGPTMTLEFLLPDDALLAAIEH